VALNAKKEEIRSMNRSVSVIIPVHNRSHLLKGAVESILAQTMHVSEIIVIDDGSSDDTQDVIPRYIAEHPAWRDRVLYFRQENQGPSVARNNGIGRAKGEWLAFNDSDDLWLPQKLEWQFRALEQSNNLCGVCFTDAWFMNNPHMKMSLFQLARKQHSESFGVIPDILKYLLEKDPAVGLHPVWVQTVLARAELVCRIGGFDPDLRCGEDDDFLFRLARESRFAFVGLPMVLIDRTPPAQRHDGASTNWDLEEFRLLMAQRRFEKRLSMCEQLPKDIRNRIRRDLALVHSHWANLYLARGEYNKARDAVDKAASFFLSPPIAIKWGLIRIAPRIANRVASFRNLNKERNTEGIA
jgi:glycosyltransferase involved in cell wall biosynthesis